MASSKNVRCGPCHLGKVNCKADGWCYTCDEGLCSTCSCHHERVSLTHDQNTIDIRTECDAHSQQIKSYCTSHLMPCCDKCISSSHSKCTGIKQIASVVETTKIEESKISVEKDINFILQFLDKMANNKSENIQRGERQHQSIKKSVRKVRKEINKHLEHLETNILKEADTVWSQEKSKLTSFIMEIKEKEKSLQELKNNLHTSKVHASKLQSFLGIHQIEQQVHQYQLYVEEQNETVREVDISLKPNDEIKQILSKVKLLISLGEVEVDVTKTTLRKETSVNKEAQVETHEQNKQPNINNMTMNIETKIHTNLKNIASISDMICLTDGRVVVVEPHGKVNILTSDIKLQKQLPIADGAWSVAQIKQDAIAITYPLLKVIKMFNIENETITNVITLDKQCWGLFFFNNALVVGLGKNEIRTLDLEGNTLRSLAVKNKSQLFHLVNCNDAVIYIDYRGKAVSCIDGSGKQIWQYQQDLSGPKGLCTDTYGNVIVADWDSDRIIVISKDGQDSKVLISEADEMQGSRCICLNESSGFICNLLRTGVYFTKINLSYE